MPECGDDDFFAVVFPMQFDNFLRIRYYTYSDIMGFYTYCQQIERAPVSLAILLVNLAVKLILEYRPKKKKERKYAE